MHDQLIWAGFVMGLFGSVHCAGMCGPIALALPGAGDDNRTRYISGRILYNLGRTVTYAFMGFVLGSVGLGMSFVGLQQVVSILAGVVLLIVALVPGITSSRLFHSVPVQWPSFLKNPFRKLMKNPGLSNLFAIGLLNGLLPCGFVYMGLIAAVGFGTPLSSAGFMILFGIGTLPMMLAMSMVTGFTTPSLKAKMAKVFPYITAVIAVILILRGLSLGIPFLSPDLSSGGHGHH